MSENLNPSQFGDKPQKKVPKWLVILIGAVILIWSTRFFTGIGDTITLEEYNKVEIGMSYEQVVEIFGEEGVEQARTEMPGIPGYSNAIVFKSYGFANSSGSNAIINFQNNRVETKAQAGLK